MYIKKDGSVLLALMGSADQQLVKSEESFFFGLCVTRVWIVWSGDGESGTVSVLIHAHTLR